MAKYSLPEGVAAAVWEFVSAVARQPASGRQAPAVELEGYYSARRGQYRVIYKIDEREVLVDVIKISHRGDAGGQPADVN